MKKFKAVAFICTILMYISFQTVVDMKTTKPFSIIFGICYLIVFAYFLISLYVGNN